MKQDYYGTKRVTAWPRVDTFNNIDTEGYAVKYEDGYTSWSPKDVFEKYYQPLNALSFGHAIEALKAGYKVSRTGWNGKGMFLLFEGDVPAFAPFISIQTKEECRPWLASQADMLANDWCVLDGP